MRKLLLMTVALSAAAVFAGPKVEWSAVEAANSLYTSTGSLLSGSDLGIQLVIDVNGDTDFGSMISGLQVGVGTESDFNGVHSSAADDVVVGSASWVYSAYYGGHYNAGIVIDSGDDAYGNMNFYFRWFDAATQGSASEAGLIYNKPSDGSWQMPASGLNPNTIVDTTFGTHYDVDAIGSVNGSSGWATIAAVPEPGLLGLLAVGVMTLVARRKRKA
jgi:hypothetical protein